jgi:hypothetical protein
MLLLAEAATRGGGSAKLDGGGAVKSFVDGATNWYAGGAALYEDVSLGIDSAFDSSLRGMAYEASSGGKASSGGGDSYEGSLCGGGATYEGSSPGGAAYEGSSSGGKAYEASSFGGKAYEASSSGGKAYEGSSSDCAEYSALGGGGKSDECGMLLQIFTWDCGLRDQIACLHGSGDRITSDG